MAGTISSTNAHKIQRHNVDNMNDMVTDLPEGILLHILSLLPTKDAIRTSILAKNWRHLWTYLSVFRFVIVRPRYLSSQQNQNKENCLLDLVGRLLHNSNSVERLSVQIFKTKIDTDKVTSLISSAAKHRVQYLKLSLGDRNDRFVLPRSFSAFESLNELHLGLKFTLHIPDGIRFPKLKKLTVKNATFSNENSFQHLLSGCPILQELDLSHFYLENIMHINVAISTLRKLRIHIDLFGAYDHNMTLKIDAVNLLSLICICNPIIKFIPVNLTSLVDAYIDFGYYDYPPNDPYAAQCAFELFSGLRSVKSLKLFYETLEWLCHSKDTIHLLPIFHNLTRLEVNCGIYEYPNEILMDILQKTPKLEVLEIPGVVLDYLDGEDLILNSIPCCFKSSLSRLCLLSFDGNEYEIKFVKFILKNAPYLVEIDIHCCSRHLLADIETDIRNQLEGVGPESCVIKFL